jgi:hypothetical protein
MVVAAFDSQAGALSLGQEAFALVSFSPLTELA